jgi:DNA-binding LacI/PurR family transcriptional regulator
VFCATSGHRADLVRICRELSLSIPSDLGLVTFEDAAPVCVESSPLITVTADANELGRTAVRYLSSLQAFQAHRHSSTHSDSAVCIRVPVRLTEGTSCLASNSQPYRAADLNTEINSGCGNFNPHILYINVNLPK